jgi:hypothetical protein
VTLAPKGLLIEEQRTNLFTYSEQFDNADWTKGNTSITANTVVAPDGTLTGDALVENTANTTHVVFQNKTVSAGTFTASVYAKAAGRTKFQFSSISGGFPGATFDLTAATATVVGSTTSASITSVGNGWFRCTATRTLAAGTDQCQIRLNDAAGASTYTGDGTSGIYIWGAQLEAGSFATSYIPTVQSQVTRATDSASITGSNFSSWYNVNAGTLYAEGSTEYSGTPAATRVLANIRSTDDANRISIRFGSNASERGGSFFVFSNSTTSALINEGSALVADQSMKFAGAYAVNDFAFAKNSVLVGTDTSGTLSVGVTELQLGAGNLCGNIKRLAYYPICCTNTQLQALTS